MPPKKGSALRVALVHDFLHTFGGAERVLGALHSMYPEAPIHTAFALPHVVASHFPKAKVITSSLQKSPLKRAPHLLFARMPRAVEEWDFSEYDLVISSSGAFSHGIISGPRTTHISYCHSPMRYAWDWHAEYLREKGWGSGAKLMTASRVISGIRLWDQVSAKRVDHWIANSAAVQARIKKFYRSDAAIINPPVNIGFFSPDHAPRKPGNYALSVSRLTPNKRLDEIIRACATAKTRLVLAGSGSEIEPLRTLARSLKANVEFVGAVSEEKKRELLAGATCFLFAAEDDFGIAPVEALSMGTPVIGLAKGGLLETVQDGNNGILYAEQNAEALAGALARFAEDGVALSASEIRSTSLRFSAEAFEKNIREFIATHA